MGKTEQTQEPSPSPEYPQEIKNVGKWNEETQKYEVDVKVTGKNLFDKGKVEGTLPIVNYRYLPIYVKKGAKVSVSCKKLSSGLGFYALLSKEKGVVNSPYSWLYHNSSTNLIVDKVTFTAESDIIYFNFDGNKQNLITELANFLQIEISDAPTSYQPYKEQTLTLTSDRPITKWDKLVEQDGQIGWLYGGKIYKNFSGEGHNIYTGNKMGNVQHFRVIFNDVKDDIVEKLYCDKFLPIITSYTKEQYAVCCNWIGGTKYFSAPNESVATVDDFKNWLKANPITIAYQLNNPEFVPLPQSEQDAIRALTTYYPTTVITADGGEVDPNIEVTYTADTKNYIDQKIEAINKAVVTTQKALL